MLVAVCCKGLGHSKGPGKCSALGMQKLCGCGSADGGRDGGLCCKSLDYPVSSTLGWACRVAKLLFGALRLCAAEKGLPFDLGAVAVMMRQLDR